MLQQLRQYYWSKPDPAYQDWLYPQLRSALRNGHLFLLLAFTPIAWVGYFFYYADYVAELPVPEPMRFCVGDVYRMVLVPLFNVAAIIYTRRKPQLSPQQMENLMIFSILLVASTMVGTAVLEDYYTAEFYAYEILPLIVFTQILLGLTFRKSVTCCLVLLCAAFFYLLTDDVLFGIRVYDITVLLTVWLPVLFGALMLEHSRRTTFQTISKLESTTNELRLKNEDLQQFAFASSHDLQEPLRSISNFVGLLDKKMAGKLPEDCTRYLHIITNSTERMKNLIRAILDYSRIGRNKSLETICTNKLLEEVLHDLSFSIQNSGASIQVKSPLPDIAGFRTEFSMLLQNLIGNALKFRRPGVPPVVKIKASQQNGSFQFSISDNGIGIEEQYKQKIFHLFGRLHSKEEYEGTGIGLTHCKKIVELHGGNIWVESTPGAGSTFHFTIPRHGLNLTYEKEITLHHAH